MFCVVDGVSVQPMLFLEIDIGLGHAVCREKVPSPNLFCGK
jgi:hypothetical protein